jgi:hypothetical protein
MSTSRDWLASLDPGTAPYVDVLDTAEIETFESCEGTEGHGFLEPTVSFYRGHSEGFRSLAVAVQRGLSVAELRRYRQVSRAGEPEGHHWELTFRAPAICRPCTAGVHPCPSASPPR